MLIDVYAIESNVQKNMPHFCSGTYTLEGDLQLNEDYDVFEFFSKALANMNEAFRNRYVTDLSIWDGMSVKSDILTMYASDLFPKAQYWNLPF